MVTFTIHFYSSVLTECNSMEIILPSGDGPWPVLWLLPPIGCNHTRWSTYTDIPSLAEMKQRMVVMPDLKLSCGLDMVHGLRFHTMLVTELPLFLKAHFSVDLTSQVIAGAKEGAYAALYAAAHGKQNYEQVIALSGGSLTEEGILIDSDLRFRHAFGKKVSALRGSDYDMENQVEKIQKHSKLYVTYGTEDCYSHSAANLGKKLLSEQVDILDGSLGWNEWYNILQKRI